MYVLLLHIMELNFLSTVQVREGCLHILNTLQ
uniref:Uncharacterized protein n=1 Tax=Siphoviridae sp. ctiOl67 TaxID=2825622 RepID=A0A8S5QJM8_9CAUD|nr:MAG TPA: hypothetical protein [Siphoviridae sp. ctiOl67]